MNKDAAKIFSSVILSERTIRIKLLGDSITHGCGGTGFAQSGEPIVDGYARNPDGYCWANMFKEYMESQYNSIVVNNGCSGTKIEFILEHFEELVDREDDIIICTIGTNNRHQHLDDKPMHTKQEHMELFYQNILKLYEKFKNAGKDVIFVANIPASAENEKDVIRESGSYLRLFHMNDVQDVYVKASYVCGFPLICLYTPFLEYCEQKNITVNSLLADGLHPNDAGHDVIFKLLMKELGIARSVTLFQ